jgi:hypothetical protein
MRRAIDALVLASAGILITGVGVVRAARAGDRPAAVIFRCESSAGEYSGELRLSEDGAAVLSGRNRDVAFTCPLSLLHLSYSPGAVVPNAHLRLARGACRGPDGAVEDRALLREIDVSVSLEQGGSAEARMQWISYLQPMPCDVRLFDRERVARAARAFEGGGGPR